MSILKRFGDIMSANINALLDKAEDPEKMVDQLSRNLNEDLAKIKAETASVMAEEARSKRELDACNSEINKLSSYAAKAVEAGNDDDARAFLTKKATLAEKQAALQSRYDLAKQNTEKIKGMYEKVSEQIVQVNERKQIIKAKMATAKVQQKINNLGASVDGASTNLDAFSRMEEKANKALDEANAMADLNSAPSDSTDDLMKKYDAPSTSSIDDELAALKAAQNK